MLRRAPRAPTRWRSSPSGTSSAAPTSHRLKRLHAQPVLFDGRNVWDPAELRALGFTYYGIGRGKS